MQIMIQTVVTFLFFIFSWFDNIEIKIE